MCTGSIHDHHHPSDRLMDRRDSTYSNASDATHKSSSTDSSGQSMSDEEAAWLLLTMGNPSSPFGTPLSSFESFTEDECCGDVETDDMDTDEAEDIDTDEPVTPPNSSPEASVLLLPEGSKELVITVMNIKSGLRTNNVNISPKLKAKNPKMAKTKTKVKSKIMPKRKSPPPSPNRRLMKLPDVDISNLTEAEQAEVLLRPTRDRRKAVAIIGFRNQPDKYVLMDVPCKRCAASDWDCYKRIPETDNNKPGPAPGWGKGCVSCHKSACSFASKESD